MVGAGGGLTLLGLTGLLTTGALPLPLPHASGGMGPSTDTERRTNRLSGAAVGLGLGLLGGGFIWLHLRARQRRPFNERIRELKHEYRELKLKSLGLSPERSGAQWIAHFSF